MLRILCSSLLVLCTASLLATNHPSPGGFGLTGEYLYLMPTVDDTYFVLDSSVTTTFPNGKRENNDFKFHSGYRVGGVYAFCNCDRELEVDYTHLSATQARTVSGSFLWATLGRADFASNFENYSGTAHSSLDLSYNRVDGFFGQRVFNCCGANLCFKFGLEYALLKFRESYEYQSTTLGTVEQKSRTWGVGPEVGLDFDYTFCQLNKWVPGEFSVHVLSTGSLLSGQTGTSEEDVLTGATTLDVSDKKGWRVIPALHAKVGLNYSTCLWRTEASLEIGYEFNSYYRGLARVTFPDDVADGLCSTNYYNFDVQGLYVSASVNF